MNLRAALFALFLLPFTGHAASKPNIILVMPDDIGYGDYACLGNPIIHTPRVDAFWKESVRFTDFHMSPSCAPSRSALLTGRHEFKNGVTHTILERERMTLAATTLADVLKTEGYATGVFGKWHLGDEEAYQPDHRGFDEMFIHGAGGIGQTYPGSGGDVPGNTYFNPIIKHNHNELVQTDGYCTDVFFAHAIGWMDDQLDMHIPFFALITPNAAHMPLQVPEGLAFRHSKEVSPDVAKFYGMIENIDEDFGVVLDKLDEWGIAKDTIVIYLGTDNGGTVGVQTFNAGMRGGKLTPYQGGTRAPSFWRWPGHFPGGRDVPALAAHLDIFPTLVELAGATLRDETKKQVEGRSLVPLLTSAAPVEWPDRTLVTHIGRWLKGEIAEAKYHGCSIRDTRYSLVNNQELYDLSSDPGEKKNVLEANPDEVAKLRKAYDQWWSDIQPMLVNENVTGPKMNPFKELYWKQFGGGPDEKLRKFMDPETTSFPELKKK